MWYIYLDESGDLGFDFVNKKPSRHFTITLLAINGEDNHKKIKFAIRKTIKRKLLKNKKVHQKDLELKGTQTSVPIKEYFYKLIADVRFGLYSITIPKRKVFEYLSHSKDRFYNYIARLVLDQIPFEKARERVYLYIDKSKGSQGISEFDQYVTTQLKARLDPRVPLEIYHRHSNEVPGLQAVDLFCNGIFKKYEKEDLTWYEIFKHKINFEKLYWQ